MRDHGSENGRRKVLKNIAATAVGVSGLAGAVRAEDTLNTTDDISPQDLDAGFDPYNQDAAARFTENFYNLSDTEQDRIETQLTDDQKRAVVDMQRPATFVRTTISVTRKRVNSDTHVEINKSNLTTEDVNSDIISRWGWDRPSVERTEEEEVSPSDIIETPTQNNLKTHACNGSDCPNGYSYYRNNTTFQHSVKGTAILGSTAFYYKQKASWDAPTCLEDGQGAGAVINKGVCRVDQDVRVDTDYAWSYKGESEEDIEVAYDDTSFTSYTQGILEGPTLGGQNFNANPVVEIRGTQAPPSGTVIRSDPGVF